MKSSLYKSALYITKSLDLKMHLSASWRHFAVCTAQS